MAHAFKIFNDAQIQGNLKIVGMAGNGSGYVAVDNLGNLTWTATAGSSYTTENAQDDVAAMIAAGTHTGISFSYNDAGNSLSATVSQSYVDGRVTAGISAQAGVANGIATLDGTGKVPASQLPAYVDDVLEYANLAAFPATGSSGIIYVTQDTNKTYRWSGSAYVEISASNVPTLDQVLVAGNGAQTRTAILGTLSLYDGGGSNNMNVTFSSGSVLFTNQLSNTKSFTFATTPLTAARTFTFPDASGTFALTSDLSSYLTTSTAASTYQPLDGDLTSIAGLAGTSGLLKKTAANTWTLDTNTYLTGNQTITLSGDVTGSGATAIATTISAATVTGKALTGYAVGTNAVLAATDTILAAFGKVQAQINAKQNTITTGTTSQYFKGDLSLGTLDTSAVVENGNLYHTNARTIASTLTGYAVGANSALAATDTILGAFQKVQGQINAKQNTITTGTTAQYFKGDLTLGTLDTSAVPENTNQYFTTARVLATALAGLSTATASVITSSDTVLSAAGKLQAQITALPLNGKGTVALGSGTTTIVSFAKSTYKSVRLHYVVYNGTNQRTGQIMVTCDGTNVEFTETATNDIGSTSGVLADVVVGATNFDIKMTGLPDATYSLKYNVDYI